MLFAQTAAPTGWTKSTTHDNKALRVVSGTASSGGTVAFTTAFASQAVNGSIANTTAGGSVSISGGSVSATTLSTSEMPVHSHGASAGATTNFDSGSFFAGMSSSNRTNNTNNAGGGGSHSHGFSAPSGSFSGTAHNHTFTGTAINLAVSYVDVIIATKN
jgi:microcystin-dependent protein